MEATGVENLVMHHWPPEVALRVLESLASLESVSVRQISWQLAEEVFVAMASYEMSDQRRYFGRGATWADAKAGALMEAVEQQSGALLQPDLVGSYDESSALMKTLDPTSVVVPDADGVASQAIAWTFARDLCTGETISAPFDCFVCPPGTSGNLIPSSNGLAAGSDITEATCSALTEVLERHAVGVARAALHLGPRVRSIRNTLSPRQKSRRGASDKEQVRYPLVSSSDMPPRSQHLIERIGMAGHIVRCRDYSDVLGIPVFECSMIEQDESGDWIYFGSASHHNAEIALHRSLTELVEVRASAGGARCADRWRPTAWLDRSVLTSSFPERQFAEIASEPPAAASQEVLSKLVEVAKSAGLGPVLFKEVTHPDYGIPVARVVIPQAETWTVFHAHTGRCIMGRAAEAAMIRASAC